MKPRKFPSKIST
uniref:Uncharacterized protein n=1 Tax=Rhizophora mucronata TaxID=61149 RepID=A0A2P2PWU1_RHIMU